MQLGQKYLLTHQMFGGSSLSLLMHLKCHTRQDHSDVTRIFEILIVKVSGKRETCHRKAPNADCVARDVRDRTGRVGGRRRKNWSRKFFPEKKLRWKDTGIRMKTWRRELAIDKRSGTELTGVGTSRSASGPDGGGGKKRPGIKVQAKRFGSWKREVADLSLRGEGRLQTPSRTTFH